MAPQLKLSIDTKHGIAIDQAIDLLGAALRSEREETSDRRARLLRSRLCKAERTTLRDRMLNASR